GASAGTGGKSESGGSGGSGGKAGSSNAASAASSDAEDDEGCGCRVAHSPAVPWSWAIVVGMMGLAWIRKRKTQGSRTRV
ncbi:MAG TPA: MYXO-CTERM sorting domain-containing protein, partial [Polyangiaceae bacterium]|nr:MYXO-CTERM sorting domain-containing protein [Polyangiaceae bacterium]